MVIMITLNFDNTKFNINDIINKLFNHNGNINGFNSHSHNNTVINNNYNKVYTYRQQLSLFAFIFMIYLVIAF